MSSRKGAYPSASNLAMSPHFGLYLKCEVAEVTCVDSLPGHAKRR